MNNTYGSRVAVLVGDFLFAQSSWFLANLENLEVIALDCLNLIDVHRAVPFPRSNPKPCPKACVKTTQIAVGIYGDNQ